MIDPTEFESGWAMGRYLANEVAEGRCTAEEATQAAWQYGANIRPMARRIEALTGQRLEGLHTPSREELDAAHAAASAFIEKNVPRMGSMPTELFTRRLKNLSPLARRMAARALATKLEGLPRRSKSKNRADARASFLQRVDRYRSQNTELNSSSTDMNNTRSKDTSYLSYPLLKGRLRRAAKRGGRPIGPGADPAEAAGLAVYVIDGRTLVREDEFHAAKRKLENGKR